MFEDDRSASHGQMTVRNLIVFEHESELGNAPSHKLFEKVVIKLKDGIKVSRSYNDYEVTVDDKDLPTGITVIDKCR